MKPRQRKIRKRISGHDVYPQGILDIIQTSYPDIYQEIQSGRENNLESLFSEEEWIDILTRSRFSYEQWLKLKK
jgi:hypothetical protein